MKFKVIAANVRFEPYVASGPIGIRLLQKEYPLQWKELKVIVANMKLGDCEPFNNDNHLIVRVK